MKSDIKINIDHLETIRYKIDKYLGNVVQIMQASERFVKVLKEQESTAFQNLAKEWESDIVDSTKLLQQRFIDIKILLERYINSMVFYVGPKDSSRIMKVDQNDIYFKLMQIENQLWSLDKIYASNDTSFPNYKNRLLNPTLYDDNQWNIREEKEQQERLYREANFAKMQDMKTKLLQDITDHVELTLWKLYNENIVLFEETDNIFAGEVDNVYDEYKITVDKIMVAENSDAGFKEHNMNENVKMLQALWILALQEDWSTQSWNELNLEKSNIEQDVICYELSEGIVFAVGGFEVYETIAKNIAKMIRRIVENNIKKETDNNAEGVMFFPKPGDTITISRGIEMENETAEVFSRNTWSREYSVEGCNKVFAGEDCCERLNYAIGHYECNSTDDDLLMFNLEGYEDVVFAGAMVEGFADIGDIVNVTLDDDTSFNFLILDVKSTQHTAEELAENNQCQCEWGHGYMLDENTVQLSVCEFITAGNCDESNVQNTESGAFLKNRSVVKAQIIDHIPICE